MEGAGAAGSAEVQWRTRANQGRTGQGEPSTVEEVELSFIWKDGIQSIGRVILIAIAITYCAGIRRMAAATATAGTSRGEDESPAGRSG